MAAIQDHVWQVGLERVAEKWVITSYETNWERLYGRVDLGPNKWKGFIKMHIVGKKQLNALEKSGKPSKV